MSDILAITRTASQAPQSERARRRGLSPAQRHAMDLLQSRLYGRAKYWQGREDAQAEREQRRAAGLPLPGRPQVDGL